MSPDAAAGLILATKASVAVTGGRAIGSRWRRRRGRWRRRVQAALVGVDDGKIRGRAAGVQEVGAAGDVHIRVGIDRDSATQRESVDRIASAKVGGINQAGKSNQRGINLADEELDVPSEVV